MNRKERRKNGVKSPVKTYTMNTDQIKELKEKIYKEILTDIFQLILCVPTLALRDEFGFGSERLRRFLTRTVFWLTETENGGVELEEIEQTLKEEVGFDVVSKVKEIIYGN